MAILPNHIINFNIEHKEVILTPFDLKLLKLLNLYHLTLVEQFFMDQLPNDLNISEFANAAINNTGSTGIIRSEDFKNNLSLSFLGRKYNNATRELHSNFKKNMVVSEATRLNMSNSSGGIICYVLNLSVPQIEVFPNISMATNALGISLRTFKR